MSADSKRRVVVIGAGVTGLAAARTLAGRYDVTLVERDDVAGGKLASTSFRGRTIDLGPDNFLTRNDAAQRLCEELGLEKELIAPATSSASIASRGRLRPFPAGLALGVPTDLVALARSGILDLSAVLRAGADLVLPRSKATAALASRAKGGSGDPTIAEVITARLGAAVLGALVDPLIGGINAGDSRRLSFAAAAPSLAGAAASHRSLLLGLRQRPAPPTPDPADAPAPLFLGLERGLGSLIAALVASCRTLGVAMRCGAPASRLTRIDGSDGTTWVVDVGGSRIEADAVLLAVPAPRASMLLGTVSAPLAQECSGVPYAGVVTVTLAWPTDAVPARVTRELSGGRGGRVSGGGSAAVLPGSGVLVPRSSGHVVTAATFTSTKWPRSAPDGEIVVRASAGRHGDDRALRLDDAELVRRVRIELGGLLGIVAPPLDHVVQRWPSSFPQYVSGHLDRVERIHRLAGAIPGLALAGAAYDGIGIPACIASAARAVAAIDGHLIG